MGYDWRDDPNSEATRIAQARDRVVTENARLRADNKRLRAVLRDVRAVLAEAPSASDVAYARRVLAAALAGDTGGAR